MAVVGHTGPAGWTPRPDQWGMLPVSDPTALWEMIAQRLREANPNISPRDLELAMQQIGRGMAMPPPSSTALATHSPSAMTETTKYFRLHEEGPQREPLITPDPRERAPRLGAPPPRQPGNPTGGPRVQPPPGGAVPPPGKAVPTPIPDRNSKEFQKWAKDWMKSGKNTAKAKAMSRGMWSKMGGAAAGAGGLAAMLGGPWGMTILGASLLAPQLIGLVERRWDRELQREGMRNQMLADAMLVNQDQAEKIAAKREARVQQERMDNTLARMEDQQNARMQLELLAGILSDSLAGNRAAVGTSFPASQAGPANDLAYLASLGGNRGVGPYAGLGL